MKDFRESAGRHLPSIPKRPVEQQGRNDFKTVRELMTYYIEQDEKEKQKKKPKSWPVFNQLAAWKFTVLWYIVYAEAFRTN